MPLEYSWLGKSDELIWDRDERAFLVRTPEIFKIAFIWRAIKQNRSCSVTIINQVNYFCSFLIQHFVILIIFFGVTAEHYTGVPEKLL